MNRYGSSRACLLALTLLTVALAGSLSACGLKGSLYLPQQKKSKVPATQTNPEPEPPSQTAPEAAPDTAPPS
jgi:predicted small lipoprotein YifL